MSVTDTSTGNTSDVKFNAWGGERQTIPWKRNMTVGDVLSAADVTKKLGQRVLVDGKKARSGTKVPQGATVVLSGRVSNG